MTEGSNELVAVIEVLADELVIGISVIIIEQLNKHNTYLLTYQPLQIPKGTH